MPEKDPTDLNHHPVLPQSTRKKDPKDLKRHPLLPPSTRNALFYTFVGITYPDNIPPPYRPPKKNPPITDFLFEWELPNVLNQSIYRYHCLWSETFNEIEHGFNNEVYETSFVDGYYWSAMEKRRFFAALDKCGPHDPAGIQQRIGPSKTVYQVRLYINLLQAAAEEYPISDDNDHNNSNNNEQLFAHEMSREWISFEERMAYHLSAVLDNEAIALDCYHRAVEKGPPPPHVTTTQQEMTQEADMAHEIINMIPLYYWAAMNPVDGIAPPTMTLETQVVFYRLLRTFVAEVMTGVILNHRRRRRQVKHDPTTDHLDIGESDIDAALRDYCDYDIDMDMDMDIKQDLVDIDSDDLDDDGEGLGFVVGENSDMDTDVESESGSGSGSGSEYSDSNDSDDSGNSDDNDADDSDNDDRSDTSAGDSDEIDQRQIDENFDIGLQHVDRLYEQELYQHIVS